MHPSNNCDDKKENMIKERLKLLNLNVQELTTISSANYMSNSSVIW